MRSYSIGNKKLASKCHHGVIVCRRSAAHAQSSSERSPGSTTIMMADHGSLWAVDARAGTEVFCEELPLFFCSDDMA